MFRSETIEETQDRALNYFRDRCHKVSRDAGWYNDAVDWMYEKIPQKWGDIIKRGIVATKFALIHSEISEALEGYRKDKQDDHLPHLKAVDVELADALIRIFDLAGYLGCDLSRAVEEKMQYNAKRADHKPEARNAPGGKRF